MCVWVERVCTRGGGHTGETAGGAARGAHRCSCCWSRGGPRKCLAAAWQRPWPIIHLTMRLALQVPHLVDDEGLIALTHRVDVEAAKQEKGRQEPFRAGWQGVRVGGTAALRSSSQAHRG